MWEEAGKTAEELYGTGLMEIGDYVNYDAGTWTDEERNSIKTGYNSSVARVAATGAPTYQGQFGGLSGSKNGTNGWRVLSINKNTITLVSADGVEQYMPCNDSLPTDNYIMRRMSKPDDNSTLVRPSWNQYVNQYATSASFFSYTELNSVLYKIGMLEYGDWGYNISSNILNSKYRYLIHLDYYYYIGEEDTNSYEYYDMNDYFVDTYCSIGHYVSYGKAIAIRVKVDLSKDVRYKQVGTKTSGGYTYKVWDISF